MANPLNITRIPASRVEVIDPRTGLMSRDWYRFFVNLFTLTGEGGNATSLDDLQIGPAGDSASLASVLQSEIQSLSVAPAHTPQLPRHRYGSFYDTTDQTAAVINTAYAMTFDTTDFSLGVTRGTPTSRVYVDTANIYNIQFSAQFINTSGGGGGGAHRAWIWLRKNGTDVPDSATVLRFQGNNTEGVAAWNFLLQMNAGDYFELMWEVDNVAVSLHADPATAIHPAISSVILTVTNNINAGGPY